MENKLLRAMALNIDIISVMASLSLSKSFGSEEIELIFDAIRVRLSEMGHDDDALLNETVNKFKNTTRSMSN